MQLNTPHHWQVQPPMAYAPRRMSGNAIASFVPGLLSTLCFSAFTGIPGLICGFIALSAIKKQPEQVTGQVHITRHDTFDDQWIFEPITMP